MAHYDITCVMLQNVNVIRNICVENIKLYIDNLVLKFKLTVMTLIY